MGNDTINCHSSVTMLPYCRNEASSCVIVQERPAPLECNHGHAACAEVRSLCARCAQTFETARTVGIPIAFSQPQDFAHQRFACGARSRATLSTMP